jgi:dTMP kinase
LGLFVTFEGPEGCGKTTQLRVLATYLRDHGCDVLTTREPGGTPISERVRAIVLDPAHTKMEPTTEFLLFSAARAQHVAEVIRPHLEAGGVVLCDRFADSSLAYQGYGYGLDLDARRVITHFATGGLVPDLTFLLDLPVEVGLRRKAGGRGDAWNRMERKQVDYHERVRAGYLAMAADEPERWVLIDATGDFPSVQTAIRVPIMAALADRGLIAEDSTQG